METGLRRGQEGGASNPMGSESMIGNPREPFTRRETHGILMRPEHSIVASSDDLGWTSIYASHQHERPYSDRFSATTNHLIILHLSGPVRVERDLSGERQGQRIGTGGLFVLPPGREFGVSLLAPLETVHLYVRGELVRAAAAELCRGDPDRIEFLPRMGEHDPTVENLARMARHMLMERQTNFFSDGVGRLVAAQLVRAHSEGVLAPKPRETGLSARQMSAVRNLIQERMGEPLSIDHMADAAGLSPIHFARQFKRTSGRAPHQFLIEMRVERAKELLAGEQSIAEIAYRCGFSHQEHMTRLFGRQVGATPAAYRKALRC